jgi:hypothetical protein
MITPFEFGVKTASSMANGAISGLIRGGLGGGLYGYMSSHPDHYANKIDERGRRVKAPGRLAATLRGILGGAAAGSAVGGGIGAAFDAFNPDKPRASPEALYHTGSTRPMTLDPSTSARMELSRQRWEEQRAVAKAQRETFEKMTPAERSRFFLEHINSQTPR